MSQNDDWAKLTKEQRGSVGAWRNRVGKILRESTDSFERDHPELIQEWTLKPETFIRADHPEKWPPAEREKEDKMNDEEFNQKAREVLAQNEAAHAEEKARALKDKTDALKSLRVTINLAIAGAKDIADVLIQRGPGGRELSLTITNLQQARMWAGEALGELGHKLPEEYRDEAK